MDTFVLNEDLARDWLSGIVGQDDPTAFSLPARFLASWDHDRVGELVELAQAVGAITGPADGVLVAFEWSALPDLTETYRFLLEYRHPCPVVLTVADAFTDMWLLDSRPTGDGSAVRGVASALGVLAQAVQAGNDLLGQLARYVASLPADQAA